MALVPAAQAERAGRPRTARRRPVGPAARAGRRPGRPPPRRGARHAGPHRRPQAPGHRLACEARRRLAIYDGNVTEHLAAARAARRPVSRRSELAARAAERPAQPGPPRRAAGNLSRSFARRRKRTRSSGSNMPRSCGSTPAGTTTRCGCSRGPSAAGRREAANYYILANIYWDQRRFAEALELYRFAACSRQTRTSSSSSRISMPPNWFKQTEAALRFLRDRIARFGKKSSQPASTLAMRLHAARPQRRSVGGRSKRPSRPSRTTASSCCSRPTCIFRAACSTCREPSALLGGRQGQARRAGSGCGRPPAWPTPTAGHGDALSLWREVLALQPLAIDAHRSVARLLAETARTRPPPSRIWRRRPTASRTTIRCTSCGSNGFARSRRQSASR